MRDPKSCLKSEEHKGAHFSYKTSLQRLPLSFTNFKSQMSWQDHKEMTQIFQLIPSKNYTHLVHSL